MALATMALATMALTTATNLLRAQIRLQITQCKLPGCNSPKMFNVFFWEFFWKGLSVCKRAKRFALGRDGSLNWHNRGHGAPCEAALAMGKPHRVRRAQVD